MNRIIQMTCWYNSGLHEGNNIKWSTDRSLSLVMDTSIASFGPNGDPSFRPSKRASRSHLNSKGSTSRHQASPRRTEATAELKALPVESARAFKLEIQILRAIWHLPQSPESTNPSPAPTRPLLPPHFCDEPRMNYDEGKKWSGSIA